MCHMGVGDRVRTKKVCQKNWGKFLPFWGGLFRLAEALTL